jgi:hypothetical protein
VVDILLQTGVSGASLRDDKNFTALHWAAFGGHLSVVQKLLPVTEVQLKGNQSKNLLHLAMWGGHPTVVNYLRNKTPALEDETDHTLPSVFTIDTLRTLEAVQRETDSGAGSETDGSSETENESEMTLLRHAGYNHLRNQNFELAAICFDLAIVTAPSNSGAGEIQALVQETICNRCNKSFMKGFAYRCARCVDIHTEYDLCTVCFEKRWQFAHVHNHYIRIPSSSNFPSIAALLESLLEAVD